MRRNLPYRENKKITKKRLSEAHSWDDFSDPVTDQIEKEYLPDQGEGETMMSQAVTAACKLIYRWFNDGDVFDNTYGLEGGANDLSSYANWLSENIPETASILERIETIGNEEGAYTDLLYDLMKVIFNSDMVAKYAEQPKTGTVYSCDGPYHLHETIICPECGYECDEDEYRRYGMCYGCYRDQQYDYEEEEEFDESIKGKRIPRLFKESETIDADEYDSGSTLSDYQKDVIRDMVKCDFECGHVSDSSDSSLREVFEEDSDFEGVVDEALNYYGELANWGPEELSEGEEEKDKYTNIPFSYDTDYPYKEEGEEEDVEHDMGEMYSVPHGASSEYALKYFENKKLTCKDLREARVAKSDQPTLDNMINIILKDFKDAGFDIEEDKSARSTAQNKKTTQLKGVFGEGIDGTIGLELDSRFKYKIIPDIDGIDFDLEGKGMASFKEDSRDLTEACIELESKRIFANDKGMKEDWDYDE